MILKISDAIKLGSTTVDTIYLGTKVVYPDRNLKYGSANLTSDFSLWSEGTINDNLLSRASLESESTVDVVGIKEHLASSSLVSSSTLYAAMDVQFEMLIISVDEPIFTEIEGGVVDVAQEMYNIWRVTSSDNITHIAFTVAQPNTYSIQQIHVLRGSTLTSLDRFAFVLRGLTTFTWTGDCNITSMIGAFYLCESLESFPLIDTSLVTDFFSAWENCSSLTTFPLLDTSSGENFSQAWRGCRAMSEFPLIDTSSATTLRNTWYNNAFTSFPAINTSSVENFAYAWCFCDNLATFPAIDTSSGTDFEMMFGECYSLICIGAIDTTSNTLFPPRIFQNDTSLVSPSEIEIDLIEYTTGDDWTNPNPCGVFLLDMELVSTTEPTFAWIVSPDIGAELIIEETTTTNVWSVKSYNVITGFKCDNTDVTDVRIISGQTLTTMSSMVTSLTNLETFTFEGASDVTTYLSAFENLTNLTTVSLNDTSNVGTFWDAFNGCTALTTVNAFDVSNAVSFESMFEGCTSLTHLPISFVPIYGTTFKQIFNGCSSLRCLKEIDTTTATNTTDMFTGCTVLQQPTSIDRTAIIAGAYWINPDACPNTSEDYPPIYNLTEELIDG